MSSNNPHQIPPDNFLPLCPSVLYGLEPMPKISDFELLKEIGKGGYGQVGLYRHKKTKCEYAIKVIDKNKFENKSQKETFAREVDIMYRINHPNVVKLYSHFENSSNCYLIMEFIKKGNLYSYMNSQPNKCLDIDTTTRIVSELLSALFYLHNMDPPVIHRDIKPENCLLDENFHLKLGDFGGSNFYYNMQRFTTCGTGPYHSPEMILNKGYDTSIDIWGVGVLIFELLTGYPPFKSAPTNTSSMKDNILNIRINWPNEFDDIAKDLICKILKFEPKERISIIDICKHEFISKNYPDAINKLIKPPKKTFVISKDVPNEENESNCNDSFLSNDFSMLISEKNYNPISSMFHEEEYEKLKVSYDKLLKSYAQLKIEKNENDNKNEQEIKSLNQRISNLIKEKDQLYQVIGSYEELKKEKEGNLLFQEEVNKKSSNSSIENFQNDSQIKIQNQSKNLLLYYKEDNIKLNECNNKYLADIIKLEEKIRLLENNNEINNDEMYNELKNELNNKELQIQDQQRIISLLKGNIKNIIEFVNKLKIGLK